MNPRHEKIQRGKKPAPFSLGIDVGSATVACVMINGSGKVQSSSYLYHEGAIHQCLHDMLHAVPLDSVGYLGVNDEGREFLRSGLRVNNQVAIIEGAKRLCSPIEALLHVGAEKFGLILFDEKGRYRKWLSNTGCAAGTGSFLDQQAVRLALKDSTHLSEAAERFSGDPPRIATRCAVFAKTDLIHAQQKGYSIEAVCAGLCQGVARNILDTVTRGITLPDVVWISGGVALNRKVVEFIRDITGREIGVVPDPEKVAAFGGASVALHAGKVSVPVGIHHAKDLINTIPRERHYYYAPLSRFPYRQVQSPVFKTVNRHGVETELFVEPRKQMCLPVYLGIDIGSTSTKAVLMTEDQTLAMGLYTRTEGQPISAVQRLLRVVHEIENEYGCQYPFIAAGTTGSGRKFIHAILQTDKAINEITAHARAAYHITPQVDTIIEIGGQDSKFTIMDHGRVVFSVMNYVCAAGTGSFLEEQAQRMHVSMSDYAEQGEMAKAPLTSDRCTVFMERDLNHLLGLGYSKEELLAAALHSVRDNYLTKVAHVHKIGNCIVFQGATGRNKGLVKAFEQKLGKPVHVSPFCHLTGALGVCLKLQDHSVRLNHNFRDDLDRHRISVTEDVCEDCSNHCKILRIRIQDEEITWGHLCGKDSGKGVPSPMSQKRRDLIQYRRDLFGDMSKWMYGSSSNTLHRSIIQSAPRFDQTLLRARTSILKLRKSLDFGGIRKEIFRTNGDHRASDKKALRIGIPNTLHFMDTFPLWKRFFQELGYRVIPSISTSHTFHIGKQIATAEFCTPIVQLHGHVHDLLQHCDYLFLPVIFQHQSAGRSKFYCYYSNYAVPVLINNPHLQHSGQIISPVLNRMGSPESSVQEIVRHFPEEMQENHSILDVKLALLSSLEWLQKQQDTLRAKTRDMLSESKEIAIVMLGRPYLIFDRKMNARIPDRLQEMGFSVLYQDMLPIPKRTMKTGKEYIDWNQWYYGDWILQAAEFAAKSDRLFPVYLTAFKCAPDSFVINYFRDIVERYEKPYLILQLDEHNSLEGYDTRLEAAVETFRNFRKGRPSIHPVNLDIQQNFEDRTYLLPNYDPLSTRLIAAAFFHHGIRAVPILETAETVQKSIQMNDGQCLPIGALVQGIAHSIDVYGLDPGETAFFINSICQLSCNLPQYPVMIQQLLNRMGSGLENVKVFATGLEMLGLPKAVLIEVYYAYLLGGLLQKMACKVRPREKSAGETDTIVRQSIIDLARAIERGGSKETVFQKTVSRFQQIDLYDHATALPKVAIIGDLYVRDNHVFNQNLIQEIEAAGAEAVTTPYNFIVRVTAARHFHKLAVDRKYLSLVFEKTLLRALYQFDKKYFRMAQPVLQEEMPDFSSDFLARLASYHLTPQHAGETAQNIMKIFHLLEHMPDIQLFVHVNPVFCCPGLISEALFAQVEKDIGIPIVSITYDGTQTPHNRILYPYLHFLRQGERLYKESVQ